MNLWLGYEQTGFSQLSRGDSKTTNDCTALVVAVPDSLPYYSKNITYFAANSLRNRKSWGENAATS
jgi:hypothetical protein